MSKESTKQALENYFKRQIKPQRAQKKNKKPEKEVQDQVLSWCKSQGWLVYVVESKAVYSQKAGRYVRGQAESGFPDVVGLKPSGQFVALELKAPGRRSTLRPAQYHFLLEVTHNRGFAAVVDSAECLEKIYREYHQSQWNLRENYLRSQIPVPSALKTSAEKLFDVS